MIDNEQLQAWHEDDQHQFIVDAILAIDEAERTLELTGWLARAFNNLGQYEQALELLFLFPDAERDAVWHYRAGYAYANLAQYEQAVQAFAEANELQPGDEDIEDFLDYVRGKLERQEQNKQLSAAARARLLERQQASNGAAEQPFAHVDLSSFWEKSDYADKEYVLPYPTDDVIAAVEKELGYKLPQSYIQLMRMQNGGIPVNTCFPTELPTSWAEDHIAITGIMGIGSSKSCSLAGDSGSRFMIEEWGYPDIGVVICDCPSAGHDVVMLDYRACGPDGEPEVIHVDQESDYEITFLAPNFESFIQGLVHPDTYDTSEADKAAALERVANGAFSPLLEQLCEQATEVSQIESKIREICRQIVEEKGYFALHADERSTLMYDVQFWLYTRANADVTRQGYLDDYSKMIAFGGEFSTGGYAPAFISDWLDQRMKAGDIVYNGAGTGIHFTAEAVARLLDRLDNY
ncbi:hypothetical protein J40TS1_18000 [Paenibacillus montaniterrae]|uniref:Knr4/Smi1-like domain-containing protein n=1 Tax=Paenibacillus montaniterrae TaxID=429341 RepID=A0A919YSM1_9BACL|nr:SMI1/KNR4 family protein [Paenibacillus montaniterrae]GIP16158.1 hypothetical protein J40TS1_18000 [Paenibacillus montaniterrae]